MRFLLRCVLTLQIAHGLKQAKLFHALENALCTCSLLLLNQHLFREPSDLAVHLIKVEVLVLFFVFPELLGHAFLILLKLT